MSDPTDIASRLEAAEQQVAETEARLPQAALRLALGNPEPGDDEVAPRLREHVPQRDMLRAAVEGAEIEERRIRAADKMRGRAPKIRSRQQKLDALDPHMPQ